MATQRQDLERYLIQSVDNALNVLEFLSEFEQDVHVTRLSERLGLNKMTVFRLLATFQRRGYVEQDQSTHRYRLGLSAFETSQKLLLRMNLLDKARPIMAQLVRQHNEAIYFVVRSKSEVLFLDMLETTQQVRTVSFIGQRFPLAETAAGKLFLAMQALGSPLPTPGQSADESQQTAADEREAIRRSGYCFNQEGFAQGIAALAAPIFDRHDGMIGALVFLGPDFRIGRERALAELAPPLLNAAETVSSRLGNHRRSSFPRAAASCY